MNIKVLDIICCPCDGGRLYLSQKTIANDSIVQEGMLKCFVCEREFPIINSIPILLNETHNLEIPFRNRIYADMKGETYESLIKHVIRHHYVAMMRREAVLFSRHFKDTDFILDFGSGWCWPWYQIRKPHIICIDFSYEALSKGIKMLSGQIDANVHLICANFTSLPIKNLSLAGVWSSRALYVRDDNKEQLIEIFNTLKNKLIFQNVFFVFDNYPWLINCIYKLFGKKMSPKIEFGDFFAKRIQWKELVFLLTAFTGKCRVRYNEVIYNPDLSLIHNLSLATFDGLLGLLPIINSGFGRQLIFECYE